MASDDPTQQRVSEFVAELDRLGEPEVRYRIALSYWGGPENTVRRPVAEEWVRQKEREYQTALVDKQLAAAGKVAQATNWAMWAAVITLTR
jgi:hypothetical protein